MGTCSGVWVGCLTHAPKNRSAFWGAELRTGRNTKQILFASIAWATGNQPGICLTHSLLCSCPWHRQHPSSLLFPMQGTNIQMGISLFHHRFYAGLWRVFCSSRCSRWSFYASCWTPFSPTWLLVIKWWKKEPKELSLDLPRGFSLPWGDWDTQLLDLQKILLPYMSTQFISGHRLKFPTKCQKRSGNAHSKGCTRVNHLMSSRPSLSCNTSKNIGESISKKISAWACNLPTFLTPLTSAKPQCHKDLTKGTTLLSSISEIQPVTRSRRVDT